MADSTNADAIFAPDINLGAARWHDLALQRWLNARFILAEGIPIPVIFSSPMDAFGQFSTIWQNQNGNNPYAYLLDYKVDGQQVYRPYPEPPKYPLISVQKKGWSYRASQNASYHRYRRISYPTVSDGVTKQELGNVVTSKMPAAWDFKYQIDFLSLQQSTQSIFITRMMRAMWRSGGTPQAWLTVEYPGHWYKKYVRVYSDGQIQNATPPEPADGSHTEFRSSLDLTIEGYNVDINYEVVPALWTIITRGNAASPTELSQAFTVSQDLRDNNAEGNPVLDHRDNVPEPA